MKNWTAAEWCMVIVALCLALAIITIPVMRAITGQTLSDNASSVLNNFITAVGVGLLSIIASKRNKNESKEGK